MTGLIFSNTSGFVVQGCNLLMARGSSDLQ